MSPHPVSSGSALGERFMKTAVLVATAVLAHALFAAEPPAKKAEPTAKKSERLAKEGKVAEKPADKPKDVLSADTFSGLELRNIGPAIASGRITDLAVLNHGDVVYIAVASGGVWKTTNHFTSVKPIFDGEGSYSIGCVTVDP